MYLSVSSQCCHVQIQDMRDLNVGYMRSPVSVLYLYVSFCEQSQCCHVQIQDTRDLNVRSMRRPVSVLYLNVSFCEQSQCCHVQIQDMRDLNVGSMRRPVSVYRFCDGIHRFWCDVVCANSGRAPPVLSNKCGIHAQACKCFH